ncbi:hypothetical protein BKA70DRAFT_764558 [Coprinopsis sp. MPI-PUGE-AT-0042]|nr:hypothetical protein BKA70DRAFT_764558 [Coprinopsis sp. MPI-PUGE-AT-0042]
MGMLRTEATPRRVEGMWSEPPPELLDSFYVPTDEEKQWAKEQIKKLESHSEPSSPHPKHPRHPKYQLLNHFAPKVSRTQRLLSHYRSITSPARKVPDEVWQAIFMELFEAEDEVFQILPVYEAPPSKEPAPLNGLNSLKKEDPWNKTAYSPKSRRMQLLSICRRWRNILLGTPDVWSRVSLDCATPEKPNRVVDKKSLAYLKWVYKRSSDMPLSIDFMTSGEKYITPRLPEELVEIVQSSVPRWRSLKLLAIHADSIWFVPPPPPDENETEPKDESAEENNEDKDAPEFPLPLTIPSLDTLTLDFDDLQTNEEEAINAIPGAPTLKHLNIVNLINIWMMPKAARLFPTLNRLQITLSFMQPAERFHTSFIHDFSNLTHFHFSGTLRWFPTQAPFPLPTVFPQIQVFRWRAGKSRWGTSSPSSLFPTSTN